MDWRQAAIRYGERGLARAVASYVTVGEIAVVPGSALHHAGPVALAWLLEEECRAAAFAALSARRRAGDRLLTFGDALAAQIAHLAHGIRAVHR